MCRRDTDRRYKFSGGSNELVAGMSFYVYLSRKLVSELDPWKMLSDSRMYPAQSWTEAFRFMKRCDVA